MAFSWYFEPFSRSHPNPPVMPREIERKFLVTDMPANLETLDQEVLEQGYLAIDPEVHEVRLRKAAGTYFLTVKSGGRLTRDEYEITLEPWQFDTLWPATKGRRLRKTRYYVKRGNPQITIDVYEGRFQGLALAEVEFDSQESAETYDPPEWMAKEVTRHSFLKNRNLLDIDNFDELSRLMAL
jgi:adenylate cyclase